MSQLVWIASYPKSGNTWLRVFLTNLIRNAKTPANINELETNPIASSTQLLADDLGYDTDCLRKNEVELLYPTLFRNLSKKNKNPLYYKVHDALSQNENGEWLFPPEATRKAIYLIRNPLDVAVSFAFFSGKTDFNKSISKLNSCDTTLSSGKSSFPKQFPQLLGTWSQHVKSWTDNASMPVCCFRYEDLIEDPISTFRKIAEALEIQHTPAQLEQAVRFSSFDELKQQEQKFRFRERPQKAEMFFRQGSIGSWKEHLSSSQVSSIIENHYEVMLRFGYLDGKGQSVF